MKPGQIIKHRLAMDVCLLISDVGPNGRVSGTWLNMGYVESWSTGERSAFTIANPEDWQTCVETFGPCLRYEKWI